MKRVLTVFAAIAAMAPTLPAQQGTPTTPVFSSATSYHVADENRTAYESWLKGKYRKYAEGLIKEEPSISGVIGARVIYCRIIHAEANSYLTIVRDGYPKPMKAST